MFVGLFWCPGGPDLCPSEYRGGLAVAWGTREGWLLAPAGNSGGAS